MRFFKRHQHRWKDVERTYDWEGDWWAAHQVQYIVQWCETGGHYRQVKLKGSSGSGPPPLRTPVPSAFEDSV